MKILTICGTRPEYIRLSQVIPKLDKYCNHILVDTGQNYDTNLRDIFYKDLNIRRPDYYLGAKGSFCEQVSTILVGLEKIIKREDILSNLISMKKGQGQTFSKLIDWI